MRAGYFLPNMPPKNVVLTSRVGRKMPPRTRVEGKTRGKPRIKRKSPNKAKSLSALKKELDQAFGRYIRARDKHTCYTCGRVMEPTKSQAGHFVPRQYLATRYDERNVHCQDYSCNVLFNGQPTAYACHLIVDYGREIIEELEAKRKIITKLTPAWYTEQITFYQNKLLEITL